MPAKTDVIFAVHDGTAWLGQVAPQGRGGADRPLNAPAAQRQYCGPLAVIGSISQQNSKADDDAPVSAA
jgi:hypothetical protein